MRAIFCFCIAALVLLSCEKKELIPSEVDLVGEWRYVGTFDHRAFHKYPLFEKEDFEKSIYKLQLARDLSFTTEINFMRGEGKLLFSEIVFGVNTINAKVVFDGYREINKPVETIEDGLFRKKLIDATILGYNRAVKEDFDTMQLQVDEYQFILLARKN